MSDHHEIAAAALARAQGGQSFSNYPAIFAGFEALGISAQDITPRENVLTYNAWIAKGRQVRHGEHGVKVCTFVDMTRTDERTGERHHIGRRPKSTTVFHVTQTDAMGAHAAATFAVGAL